ncbi:response regulator [Ghiorsea bivora]|uniref:response regulator n=1 Tax=Ghiorsea bivora TaxID=1485545 RepID=UPI0005716384|nr:response regulator [Ghiorsea bivora]
MSDMILIIEDNLANLKLVSAILNSAGYNVCSAMSAEAGLLLVESEHPDLILMDIQLPGMDGLTATARLKQNPATRDIPVIALTAFAMKGDRERMLAGGCDDYVTKPIDYKQFLVTVAQHLEAGNHD